MEQKPLLIEVNEGIMNLTLNRPETLNAFSMEMELELIRAIQEGKSHPDVRVITIQGAGRAFSSGGDISNMGASSSTYQSMGILSELIMSIQNAGKPIVALVHGYAAGMGFSIALACDMILASEDSKFIMSFAKVGLIADGGGSYFLPRLVGVHRAKELLFTAEPLNAEKAHQWGIVNHVFPSAEFKEKTAEVVEKLANGPSKSYEMTKKLVNQALVSDLEKILELERLTQPLLSQTNDHEEGVNAFMEKRTPQFMGT